MRKLIASIDKKALKDRPELIGFLKDVQAKEAALEQIKAQKDAAKHELKLAVKALKKELKSKPPKKEAAKPTVKATVAAKKTTIPRTGKAPAKKHTRKTAVVA